MFSKFLRLKDWTTPETPLLNHYISVTKSILWYYCFNLDFITGSPRYLRFWIFADKKTGEIMNNKE